MRLAPTEAGAQSWNRGRARRRAGRVRHAPSPANCPDGRLCYGSAMDRGRRSGLCRWRKSLLLKRSRLRGGSAFSQHDDHATTCQRTNAIRATPATATMRRTNRNPWRRPRRRLTVRRSRADLLRRLRKSRRTQPAICSKDGVCSTQDLRDKRRAFASSLRATWRAGARAQCTHAKASTRPPSRGRGRARNARTQKLQCAPPSRGRGENRGEAARLTSSVTQAGSASSTTRPGWER